MSSTDAERHPAVASRQKEVGVATRAATRRRLVDAAGELFLAHGYAATTVTALARAGGVSVQTLYQVAGGKSALLRAVLEEALRGSAGAVDDAYVARLRAAVTAAGGDHPDPRERVRALARVYRQVAGRAGPWWRLYRDAAATEEEIAADWAELTRLRRGTLAQLLEAVPDAALRSGLAREDAVDTLWAVASPETHSLLVDRAGWSLDRYEAWVADTLVAALLEPGGA